MTVNKFGFTRWNFLFEIDGFTTLDPDADHNLLRRIAGRQSLFMDPLIKSGYLKGKRVLDLGSNSGYWSYLAVTAGGAARVDGVEASPELVDQARFVFEKKGIPPEKYNFILADAYRYLKDNADSYDVILCLGFFYHINDPVLLLSLMHNACSGYVVIDTIVDKSPEAAISVRPVQRKTIIEEANITLELVSSPKAIHWMAEEVGFAETRNLYDTHERIVSMWDYLDGCRAAYVLSAGAPIEEIWPKSTNPDYLGVQDDLARYGYFPEMHLPGGRVGRDAELAAANGAAPAVVQPELENVGVRKALRLLIHALKCRFGHRPG